MTQIAVGMQVVVRTPEEDLMGTVIETPCPIYPRYGGAHVLIEGDKEGEEICFSASWIIPYIDIYEERVK